MLGTPHCSLGESVYTGAYDDALSWIRSDVGPPLRPPYLDDGDVRLYLGDCVEVMREMDAESVDAIVCDPPYGLEFMGKEWDRLWNRSESNFDHRPNGGFSPFTKQRPQYVAGKTAQDWHHAWATEALRVLKPGGHLLAFGGTRTFHRLTCGIEDAGFEIRDTLSWLYGSGFPKSLDVSKAIDKAAGAERDVVGSNPYNSVRGTTSDGTWVKGSATGFGGPSDITAPATDAARQWQGFGTALKPAWEPVVVARKPLIGTVAANVQATGCGAVNVDGCRIGTDAISAHGGGQNGDGRIYAMGAGIPALENGANPHVGRWPANVCLDEEAARLLDEQSGERASGSAVSGDEPSSAIWGAAGRVAFAPHSDTGGASRFFYTAKASRADRNTSGADNTHPTVKPTDLMRWLVRLVCPPGGLVLDPFAGSGTTLVAARAEGFRAIGIEMDPEYAAICSHRLSQLSLLAEGM